MKIQKWLVPGRHNNYHPHALRPIGLSILVLLLIFINGSYNFTVARKLQVLGYATSISPYEIVALTNQERANRGLGALSNNAQLTQAAQSKAQHMFANNYWAHNAPDGTTPWYFISASGYSYTTAGENLAKDFNTSAGVMNGWMNSPGHQANVLGASFKDMGVAVVDGTLQGSQTTLVVALYAAPTAPAPAPAPAAPTAPKPVAPSAPQQQAAAQAPQQTNPAVETAPPPLETPPSTSEPLQSSSNQKQVKPAGSGVPSPSSPEVFTNYIIDEPISFREKFNWAQSFSLYTLSIVFLLMVLKHTVVWRTQRRGWRHIWMRAHPAAQYGLIFVAMIASVASGTGVIR